MIKRTLLLSLLLATASLQAQDQAPTAEQAPAAEQAPVQDTAPLVEERKKPPEICTTCHGDDGNNWVKKDDGTFGKTDGGADSPKLAGQHSEYLFKQFSDFKSGARENPKRVMNGMIALLPDEQMKATAEFFSSEKLIPAEARDAQTLAEGQKIWRTGIASKGLPACAACHGPAGKGMPSQYPALAGQFPDLIEAQLKSFRDGVRANDPSKMMRDIAIKMTDPEIKVVSDYAASLR
jgi:cytochrome c553